MELPTRQLKVICYNNIFPDLSRKEFNQLKKSIEKWGIIEPIVINQHNIIICGKERYRAALLLGIEKVQVVIRKTNGAAEIQNISLEENLRRKHLSTLEKVQEVDAFHQLNGSKKKGKESIKKESMHTQKKITTKRLVNPPKKISRYRTPPRLIPELSKLLDEGKINKESASVYAKVSLENQKRIYGILMDNFSN